MVSPGQSDFREATVRYELPVEEPRPAEPAKKPTKECARPPCPRQ